MFALVLNVFCDCIILNYSEGVYRLLVIFQLVERLRNSWC